MAGGVSRVRAKGSFKLKIAYLVHDLSDPAVHRRVRMLKAGSAQVVVIGFRRTAERPRDVEGCETVDLGETRDGAFIARIGSIASVAMRPERFDNLLRGCQVVLARNLEMLFLATKARRRYAPGATLYLSVSIFIGCYCPEIFQVDFCDRSRHGLCGRWI